MADLQSEKFEKIYESRVKAKAQLNKYQQQLMEAVDNEERKVRFESLVESFEKAMAKSFGKHEQL